MKKIFTTGWVLFKYIFVYILMNIIISMFMGMSYILKSAPNLDILEMQQFMNQNVFVLTFLISFFSLIVFLIMIELSHKSINKFLRFKKISLKNINLLIMTSIGFCTLTICLTDFLVKYFPSYNNTSKTLSLSLQSYFSLACVIVLLPIFEEIFFRGILFNELRNRINLPLSIIIQALIFGIFHGNIIQGIYTFCLAIVLACVYTWTDTLWAPIIVHIFFNLLGSLILPPLLFITSKYTFIYIIAGSIFVPYIIYLLYVNNHNFTNVKNFKLK